jgi:hypothetical protein
VFRAQHYVGLLWHILVIVAAGFVAISSR